MEYKLIRYYFFLFFILGCQSKSSRFQENKINDVRKSVKVSKKKTSKTNLRKDTYSIVTWNIQDLGRSKSSDEIVSIAKIIKDYDIVAIQEIVGKDPAGIKAVALIVDELNRLGSKWDYRVSNPTKSPSSNISERYGFLWKTSRVSIKGKPKLDNKLEELCYREPFIGDFKVRGKPNLIKIINYHSRKHNDKPEEEIKYLLDYPKRFPNNNLIICGDFNLNEKHSVWDSFYDKGFVNALINTPTTLKRKCKYGSYLNHSVDNIYYKTETIEVVNSGHIDFVKTCDNLKSSRMLSDHLPVFLEYVIN